MHRIIRVPCFMLLTALLGLVVFHGLGSSRALAQDRATVVPVAINGSQSLEMSRKQRIKTIDNKDPNVATVDFYPGSEYKTVMVKGGAIAGISRLILTDVEDKKESFDIVVELNVDYLRRVLAQAAPTANIQLVQGTGGTLILTGTVAQASDIAIVMQIASVAVGDSGRVINALKIGGLQQVQLDVVIARVARSEARNLGLSFQENGAQLFLDSTVGGTGSLTSTLTSSLANVASSIDGTPNASWGIVNNQRAFLGFLEALRTENLVKVIAKPKVCTLTGQPAEFLSGGEQAVPVIASGSAGGGAVSGVDFKPFGTTIRFLPLVLGGGKIYLEVEPQFTFPDPSNLFSAPIPGTNSVVFGRDTQRVKTSAVLEDGQTMAIGGMIFHQVNGTASKVPVLGDIPFCGAFFRTVNYSDSEEELLILITPHLVDAMSCDQVPKCLPGEETRKPDDFELFLEGILEAPRGQRCVWHDNIYVPAYKNSPTASMFPCPGWNGPRGAGDLGCCNGPGCPTCCDCPYGGYPMGGVHPTMGAVSPVMGTVGPVMGGVPGKDQTPPSANTQRTPNQQQSLAIPQPQPPATYMQRQAAVETVPMDATMVETVPVTVAPLMGSDVRQVNGSAGGVTLAAPRALEGPR